MPGLHALGLQRHQLPAAARDRGRAMKLRLPVLMIRTTSLSALRDGTARAAVLRTDLDTAEAAIEACRADLIGQDGVRQRLAGELAELRSELESARARTDGLTRLAALVLAALEETRLAAEAPVSVLLHDGMVQSVHRDPKSAMVAAPLPWADWVEPGQGPDGPAEGWKVCTRKLPPLPAPDTADEMEALLEWLKAPEPGHPSTADTNGEVTTA
ncbi:hypothetical protein AB0G74_27690 [Streptomyces sp. NPDC020875]|uniref:hypothetical protein n=1 Tax=Streptomyces sp. NPDC020875 TaxID=3154898 RepID=UPI0033C508E1